MKMTLELLPDSFSVCQLKNLEKIDWTLPVYFLARTPDEISWVGPSSAVPENCTKREDGWRALRVCGTLDFSLVGILSHLTSILARHAIPVFALSTYDTDYLLIKQEFLSQALSAFSTEKISLFS